MHLFFHILDWEIRRHAHIINMSYTHPQTETQAQKEQHKETA